MTADHLPMVFVQTGPHDLSQREVIAIPAAHAPHEEPGSIIGARASEHRSALEAGAGLLRWRPPAGIAELIFTRPQFRRRGVATALWQAATLIQQQLSAVPLRPSPERTALGEAFVQGLGISAPLQHLSVPMTLREHARGVRRRHLVPDDPEAMVSHLMSAHGICQPLAQAACQPSFEHGIHVWEQATRCERPECADRCVLNSAPGQFRERCDPDA